MNVDDIALTLERGLGPKKVVPLLEVFGTAGEVYSARPEELVHKGGLKEPLARQIARKEFHGQAEAELKYIKKHGIAAIASTDEDYPPLMREMNDYPHVIYVRGEVAALHKKCLSMVGTRKISTYGQTMCDRFVRQLSERVPGLCVVSGLAFGIDVHCHRAALRYGVPTVAVVANTLPEVTPAQHADIARDILDHGGAIVSECHSNSKQTGDFYLARNRIIAGLSEGTLVVEAAHGSGALSTAEFAFGYDRTLMAMPGRAIDEAAFGTNNLVKSNRAAMVCSGEDIVRAMMWDVYDPEVGEKPVPQGVAVSENAQGLLGCFVSGDGVSVDELVELTALEYSALAPLILELELSGKVKRLPGGHYQKIS